MASKAANSKEQFPKRLPIGQILVENGCVPAKTLNAALARQRVKPKKIGAILTSMNVCSGRQVAHALALQNHLPWLCLENSTIENRIIELIPQKIALQFKLIPVCLINQQLVLATEDPLNPKLKKFLAELEYQTVLAAAPVNEVEALLGFYYGEPVISERISQTNLDEIRENGPGEWFWPEKRGKTASFSSSTLFDVSKTPLSKPTEVADLFGVTYPAIEKVEKNIPFAGLRPAKTKMKTKTKKEDSSSEDVALHQKRPETEITVTEITKPSRHQNQVQAVSFFEAGIVKLQTGGMQEALELFEKSSALDPDNRVCKANIKRIQQRLKGEDIKGF